MERLSIVHGADIDQDETQSIMKFKTNKLKKMSFSFHRKFIIVILIYLGLALMYFTVFDFSIYQDTENYLKERPSYLTNFIFRRQSPLLSAF